MAMTDPFSGWRINLTNDPHFVRSNHSAALVCEPRAGVCRAGAPGGLWDISGPPDETRWAFAVSVAARRGA